jgi:hypothetical protein
MDTHYFSLLVMHFTQRCDPHRSQKIYGRYPAKLTISILDRIA